MNHTYRVYAFGCKASQSDSLSYAGLFQRAGWVQEHGEKSPSLIVVQTCTVTMSADAQARQLVRKLKRENPESKILLTGCYAERAEAELRNCPEVDYIIGNLNPRKIELLSQIAGGKVTTEYSDFPMPVESARTRQYLKIQDGCDARCSYCIIPFVRGKSRSLPIKEVLRRVEYFRDLGYKELIFTGISMGGYGKDLVPKTNLGRLMREVENLRGDFRIRLSSVEPEEIDQEFIDVFISSSRFQPHLHLPLQSASDRVLRKMRRKYLFRRYDAIVDRLFSKIPDLNLGTDLLVGFPEEDRDAFEETYRSVQEMPFSYCHVFPFSPRPGTTAASYPAAVGHEEVSDRAARLRELSQKKNLQYRSRFLGQTLRALLLRGTPEALTDNYIRVRLQNRHPASDIVYLKVDSIDETHTYGTLVN